MVGIVVVSHSDTLAESVVLLAREMSPPELKLEAAGGMGEPGVLGTSADLVRAAIERAMSPDGVLVVMDLGSALMTAEFAVELLEETPGPVRLSDAPLVEGTVAAAAAAGGGASLDEVAAEARAALAMKAAQIGSETSDVAEPVPAGRQAELTTRPVSAEPTVPVNAEPTMPVSAEPTMPVSAEPTTPVSAEPTMPVDAEAELLVANDVGLHARPAARFVQTVGSYEADVRVAKADGGAPVSARSLTNLVALGARRGDRLIVTASGPQAREAVAALEQLAAAGFGDGIGPPGTPSPPSPPAGGLALAGAPRLSPTPAGPPRQASQAAAAPQPPAARTVLTGIAGAAGTASGAAHILGDATAAPPQRQAETPEQELALLERGLAAACAAITRDREQLAQRAGGSEAEIFDAHLALLDDDAILAPARAAIADGLGAEQAYHEAIQQTVSVYRALPDPLLAERAADVVDVGRRVISALTGGNDTGTASGIVVADELTPVEAARLDPELVTGIVTARGSATAHAAIIARALGLPAVLGAGPVVLAIQPGTILLVDGDAGTIEIDPPTQQLAAAQERDERRRAQASAALAHAYEDGLLASGERIEVFANIGAVEEAELAVQLGAEGVGLLRTEFLFLNRPQLPSEDEQAETLRQIAVALDGRPLIVRTLDAGADKPLPAVPMPPEANPFLGVRGIRLGLLRPELLATQLRAVLRVADQYPLKLMLPMVATLAEIEATRELLERTRADTGVTAAIELGIMVEVPAAALTALRLAPHVDFFSLGTNDLTQYTMAAERGDARLAPLLATPQPAVLRLVQATVEAAASHGRWVGVCGEMAGDPPAAILLAGLGVTELSMAPRLIPEVKAVLRRVELRRAREAAAAAVAAESAAEARALALELL
ncbi:MAG TPA: phosphoenolpyruvate--protein phosphotransferase [Solirubrobacteraceae bacterium]|nr:phosphoenolpyruvate--protein phosphotransferase [Solirubrobacteraceae bacterium]